MKIKFLSSLLLSGVLALASGCVSTVDGNAKAGVPFAKDTIVRKFDRTMPQANAAAREVLSRNGKLTVDYIAANTLEAKIDERTVWVQLYSVEPKVVQVTVQARRGAVADIELSADISTQIALQLMSTTP